MKTGRFFAWLAIAIGCIYFFVPLIGTFEFSLRARRGVYSFDAYQSVFADASFRETFGYSMLMALLTIIFGMLLVVPTDGHGSGRVVAWTPQAPRVTILPVGLTGFYGVPGLAVAVR